jgi:hypothetical protein
VLPIKRNYAGHNYFSNLQCTVLTFLVYFKIDNTLYSFSFTFTSYILNHDGLVLSCAFIELMMYIQHNLPQLNRFFFFSDNGQPFRSAQFFFTMFKTFPSLIFSFHFFAEYHGKCEVDAFFGNLSMLLKRVRLGPPIFQIQEFVRMLNQELNAHCKEVKIHIVVEFVMYYFWMMHVLSLSFSLSLSPSLFFFFFLSLFFFLFFFFFFFSFFQCFFFVFFFTFFVSFLAFSLF